MIIIILFGEFQLTFQQWVPTLRVAAIERSLYDVLKRPIPIIIITHHLRIKR